MVVKYKKTTVMFLSLATFSWKHQNSLMYLTVVMCSSVISSLTPHLISTTCVYTGKDFFNFCPDNDLVLEPMLLPAVLLDLGVDVLHQTVPLHQHVSES